MARFACRSCGQTIEANDSTKGQPITCPKCGAACEVPGSVVSTAAMPLAIAAAQPETRRARPFDRMAAVRRTLTIIITVVSIPFVLAIVFAIVSAIGRPSKSSEWKHTQCARNIGSIGKAIAMYQGSFGDHFPATLDNLIKDGQPPSIMTCPSDAKHRQFGFFYLAPTPPEGDGDPDTIIACDFADNHPGDRSVLFADIHIASMNDQQFAQAMAQPRNAKFAAALKTVEDSMGIGGK